MLVNHHKTALLRLSAVGSLLAVAISGCSSEPSQPESKRKCAVVQAEELTELVGQDMKLEKAQQGSTVCRFVSKEGTYVVHLNVEGPVENGFPKLLLTDPQKVDGVGAEAYLSNEGTPLGTRLITRDGGAMLTVDLQAPGISTKARRALVTDIAKAGVGELPEMEVKPPGGKRGDEACEAFESDEVAAALGGVPDITPSTPPGSCTLTVEASDLTVLASLLMERGAGEEQLDALVANVDTAKEAKVGDAPAYWIEPPTGDSSGGQLDVLDGDRILQVAVIGVDLDSDEAQAIATTVAEAAIS